MSVYGPGSIITGSLWSFTCISSVTYRCWGCSRGAPVIHHDDGARVIECPCGNRAQLYAPVPTAKPKEQEC